MLREASGFPEPWDETAERRLWRMKREGWETRDKEYCEAASAEQDDYIERWAIQIPPFKRTAETI